MVKLQFTGSQYLVTIPVEYVQQAGWEKADDITVSFNERGNLELADVTKKVRERKEGKK